ncbi:DNA-formamidopyrimidine glycosylase [Vibrio sp. HA2012]|uniref:bifunctional DNA-formamidopyrimidine glycosylase/DNA-(apurinic or apyrimidinic site) lyase n=1 Tax=Vibrio sp. HA2012 TaxID=1971595 RepID=UPI000C2CD063|nr:bifunctional DNA-formamidopyrimidine glycosylase/DNA-(apurinic or apyrimidinic site) lyase [Vibrio sp. HA2012]PJC85217.1 DNA-formamidopyrimidine glycosylase [Vibrio sp. HA2012]
MPELPEVEVSRMGIEPHLLNQTIQQIVIRQPKLRWLVSEELNGLQGQMITAIQRRAKYLLLETEQGSVIIHLGMSGSLRVLGSDVPHGKHDHIDLVLTNGKRLRYNDPRRFGAWLWQDKDTIHELLGHLGPEPLQDKFTAVYMQKKAKGKRVAIKQFIMDSKIVVGVGNIYANESLFNSGILPSTPAGKLTSEQWVILVTAIKAVLADAIKQGGTTLKDFSQADGKPGYFVLQLQVYGKAGEECPVCGDTIQQQKIGQRNSYFCPNCQH